MVTHRLGVGLLAIYVVAAACASAPKLPVFGTWKVATFSGPAVPQTSVMAMAWVGVSASFARRTRDWAIDVRRQCAPLTAAESSRIPWRRQSSA